jgi:hypothetical protein
LEYKALALSNITINSNTMFKKHIPIHLYFDEKIYFVTSSTLKKEKFFDTEDKKELIKKRLKSGAVKFNVKIFA